METPSAYDLEILSLIRRERNRFGDVHRALHEGLGGSEIASKLGLKSSTNVYAYISYGCAAAEGRLPSAPSTLVQTGSTVRMLIKRSRAVASDGALDVLEGRLAILEDLIYRQTGRRIGTTRVRQARPNAVQVLPKVSGIYAFTYGWYLECPSGGEGGNTQLKVGRAENVAERILIIRNGAKTHVPEPLVVVRIYRAPAHDLPDLERTFHRRLRAEGHHNPRRGPEVGKEWFLTNTHFLDECAAACGLEIVFTGESAFAEAKGAPGGADTPSGILRNSR